MNTLICFSHLRWDFVWQRPQHLLSRLAAHYRVLFVEEPVVNKQITHPQLEFHTYSYPNAKVTVIRLQFPASTDRWIGHGDPTTQQVYIDLLKKYMQTEKIDNPIVWLYTPMALDFAKKITHSLLIFDVMDQLSAFKGAPAKLVACDRETMRRANIVFTGGVSLYRDKLPLNPNTHLFPSGVESHHFAQAAAPTKLAIPVDMADIRGPILGYFGVIDERVDLALIAHLATTHPEWNLVLVGPVLKIDPADLPQGNNIHYLGMKSYAELPAYLAWFDVALVPFALNESTRFISPTKTLEYMAAFKPIISTPIHDVIELYGEAVRVGCTPVEFEQHVLAALTEPHAVNRPAIEKYLAMSSWNYIASRMTSIIDQYLKPQGARKQAIGQLVSQPNLMASEAAGDR